MTTLTSITLFTILLSSTNAISGNNPAANPRPQLSVCLSPVRFDRLRCYFTYLNFFVMHQPAYIILHAIDVVDASQSWDACIIAYQETFSCNYIFVFVLMICCLSSHAFYTHNIPLHIYILISDNNSRWQLYWYWRIRSNYYVGKFCIIIQWCCFAGE